MFNLKPPAIAGICIVLLAAILAACGSKNQIDPRLAASSPQRFVWAWERPEDLSFLEGTGIGVAFLAQTLFLAKDDVNAKPRRQPLDVAPGTYILAVTRIETNKEGESRPTFTDEMARSIAKLVVRTLELPDVKGVQIDFDAVTSEREFYEKLISELRAQLPADTPLTMTALASWCTGDAWFNSFRVDEAVPMAFQMGADDQKIRNFLRKGNDWNEPLCRGSYGLSVDEPLNVDLKPGRRKYYFKDSAWQRSDLDRIR